MITTSTTISVDATIPRSTTAKRLVARAPDGMHASLPPAGTGTVERRRSANVTAGGASS
jgi:hypothetical protein